MELITHGKNRKITEIRSDEQFIQNAQDALDLIGNCFYNNDSNRIIISEKHLSPDFFVLKTRLAGDILQKFSTYKAYLAIVGDFSKYESKSLSDFIFESNKQGRVLFLPTIEEAVSRLDS